MAKSLIDIRKLPPPDVVEPLSLSEIKKDIIAQFKALMDADFKEKYGKDYELLESDPAAKILEVCAYRELILRARVNDAAKRTLPAFAKGSDLTHVMLRYDVVRGENETDDKLLSLLFTQDDHEAAAGSKASYIATALNLELKDSKVRFVEDANAVKGEKDGQVIVYLFFSEAFKDTKIREDDITTDELLKIATKTILYRSPLTDKVEVKSCIKTKFYLAIAVKIFDGADQNLVLAQIKNSVTKLFKPRLGQGVPKSLIYAAIHAENDVASVEKIEIKKEGFDAVFEELRLDPGEVGILNGLTIETINEI